jgi:drug/metabolite transporter (DMT)-like permease
MTNSSRKLGLLLGFLGMCLFAGTLPATRLAVSGFDPLFLTVARAALAGSAGLIVLLITRRRLPPRSAWLKMFGAALCTVVGFPLFAALAMMTVAAAHGGVVLGILPLATAAAAAIFAHERPSRGFWLASAAGAIIVVTFMFRRSGSETFSAGDLFLLGTVAAGALGYTFSGRLAALMPGWEVISWQVVIFGAGDVCAPAGRYRERVDFVLGRPWLCRFGGSIHRVFRLQCGAGDRWHRPRWSSRPCARRRLKQQSPLFISYFSSLIALHSQQ